MPTALVIRTAGTNCDRELVYAFTIAGARSVQLVHLRQLIDRPSLLDAADLIGIPGGFSYGDDIAAGRIFAMLIRQHLYEPLRACVERGVPIFGPCNGFQIMAQAGLLPGFTSLSRDPKGSASAPVGPPAPTIALAPNIAGRFVDDWLDIEVVPDCPCIWTAGITDDPVFASVLPIAHGEGRFITDNETLDRIESAGLVAMRYAESANVNGSMNRIAGICDPSGLIFGLMPHPERFTIWQQHPAWTRLDRHMMANTEPIGLRMFRNAVAYTSSQRHAELKRSGSSGKCTQCSASDGRN